MTPDADPGGVPTVRRATVDEARSIAELLYMFNTEFNEPTPSAAELEQRIAHLIKIGDTVVLLVGARPDGLVLLRFRDAIWSSGLDCYLSELYVIPAERGKGLGRALLEAALHEARDRGADSMEVGVDEPDDIARRLYESFGFSNRVGGSDGPFMYVYERELDS